MLEANDSEATTALAMKALAEPSRLQLVALLHARGPARQVELIDMLDHPRPWEIQSTISHHMRVLVAAGLVEKRQSGKAARWAVAPKRFLELAKTLRWGVR